LMPLHANHTMNSICLTDWLTHHQLCVTQTAIVASYRKIKCGVNRNLNIDHISNISIISLDAVWTTVQMRKYN
jgi:hypothetical protein